MIAAAGCGSLVRLQGSSVNADIYKQILQQYVISQFRSSPFQHPTFMHDNVPCRTLEKVKLYLVNG